MGKFLLLLVASAAVVGAIAARQNLVPTTSETAVRASREAATVLAEQAAWGGLEEAAESIAGETVLPTLAAQFTSRDDVSGSRYRVTVTPNPMSGVLTARSQGWAGTGAAEGQAIMEVDFALRDASSGDYEPPSFMKGLIRSNRVVHDGGDMRVSSEDPAVNADFYTNEYFNARGTPRIPGFLYHSGDISASKLSAALRTFQPTDNPDGLASVQRTDPFVTPYFNPPDYLSKATEITPTQLTLYGTVPLGTKENPKVWYVNGNLTVGSAGVRLEGFGIFIINGSLNVTNQFTVADSSPAGNSVAFYARDEININNEVDLAGQFFANGAINLSARSTITGSLTADQIQFGRTTQLIYRAPSSWQTNPLFGPSSAPDLSFLPVAYRAWNPALEAAGR